MTELFEKNGGLGLIEHSINFYGDNLICYQDNESNKIYVAIRWVCEAIGIDDTKIKNQVDKIQSDVVLKRGWRKITIPTKSGEQGVSTLCLDLLHLWLAKINANIIKDIKLQNKVIKYQLEIAEFLKEKFLQTSKINFQKTEIKIPTTLELAKELHQLSGKFIEALEENEILTEKVNHMKPKVQQHDIYLTARNSISMNEVSKIFNIPNMGQNNFFQFLRNENILMSHYSKKNLPFQKYMDLRYFKVKESFIPDLMITKPTTRVTPKGVEFIYKLLLKKGLLSPEFVYDESMFKSALQNENRLPVRPVVVQKIQEPKSPLDRISSQSSKSKPVIPLNEYDSPLYRMFNAQNKQSRKS